MKTKIKIVYLLIMSVCCIYSTLYIYAENVQSVLNPLKGDVEKNVTSLTTVVFIMLGIFAILALIETIITGNKSQSTNMLSNKGIRFLEVLFLIILLVLLVYEYINIQNIVIKVIGIILSLFTFYQRVSNKNRKWAYTVLTLDMLLYIGINVF